ncbi:MAG: hypothetical protein K8W52_28165 [Deltaproteobacteria bacterium]|nr:hypothetical protein [Deltaproteobacteria bacterium]
MRHRHVPPILSAALLFAACAEPPDNLGVDAAPVAAEPAPAIAPTDEPATAATVDVPELLEAHSGESCAPRACVAGECGLVDDGCRAQMWCGECACGTTAMSCEKSLTQIWEQPLAAGTHTIIVTTLFPADQDPVLHVITSAGAEAAWDDNSAGGTRPRVTVTVPSGQTRIALLRPKADTTTGGAALVTIDGQSYIMGVRGRRQVFANLRANEEIETIQLPGSTHAQYIYGMSADGEHITQRVYNNGTAGGAVLTQLAAATSRVFWLGSDASDPQPTQLIRNDRRLTGHDAEPGGGDGLGSELEAAIGTCSILSGYATNPKDLTAFPCGWAIDARDTDGDGINDGDELRGVRTQTPQLPLRRWGADPRHKDMFVEVDGAHLTATDSPPRVTPAQARYFADTYGDRLRDLTSTERGQHANTLRNPDQRPGISAHLDIGLQAETPADLTVYGDWGGYGWVAPVGNGGADPQAAWQSNMAASRVGKFRYALVWNGGGGQTSTSATCAGCGSYAWGSSNQSGAVMAHESGHANAIAHSGPAGITPIVDPNCKPNWPSIMSYAFQNAGVGFADGTGVGTLDNVGVSEVNAVNPWNFVAVAQLRDKFKYLVDSAGGVDWNRDGVIASSGTVRAYTNFEPGNACEYTRYNAQWITSQMTTALSPAIARLGNRTFMFSGGQSQLRYVSSTDDFDCAISASGCGAWGGYGTFGLDVTGGVDAAITTTANQSALVVVGVDAQGWINSTLRLPDGTWAPVQWTGIWAQSSGEPAVETLPDGRVLLLMKQSGGNTYYAVFRYDGGSVGTWERWGQAVACDGTPMTESASASPGLARTDFAGVGKRVWGLFSTDVSLYLKSFDSTAMCFRDAEVPLSGSIQWPVSGRPAGVWVPDASNAMGGRLTIIATNKSTDPSTRFLSQIWSYYDTTQQAPRIGQLSGFDSWWTYSYGVDGWFDAGIDDNLRVVWSVSPQTAAAHPQELRFAPRADGINDFPLVNYNDWEALRYAICFNLAAQVPAGARVACPARPW